MDRRDRLREALEEAYAAGEELLRVLQEPVTPVVVDQVEALVNRRDMAAQEAFGLFQAGDEVVFGDPLQRLVQQQQALDEAIRRLLNELAKLSQAAAQAKSSVRGARQVMDAGRRGRMLDQMR